MTDSELFKHVLTELKELRKCVNKLRVDVELLNYKSGIWGSIGAGLVLAVTYAVNKIIGGQ